MNDDQSPEEWLAICRAEAKLIDPATAVICCQRGDRLDPYGLYPDTDYWILGEIFFARRPGSEIWVAFDDLPTDVLKALRKRAENELPTRFNSLAEFAAALRRAAAAHGEHEKLTGHPDPEWAIWYARYIAEEQAAEELPF